MFLISKILFIHRKNLKMLDQNQLDEYRKDLKFSESLCGQSLNYQSTWGIFSPREIDSGTKLLMKYIEVNPEDDCFDLGCGYGPIGLTMAKLAPKGETILVDKDFMAVEYANKNAKANNINNAKAQLSNGFQHIESDRRRENNYTPKFEHHWRTTENHSPHLSFLSILFVCNDRIVCQIDTSCVGNYKIFFHLPKR